MPAAWALEVIDQAPYVTLSMVGTDGRPYAIPISVARTDDTTLYLHCALEGEKLDAINACPEVCLTAVTAAEPKVGPAQSFTMAFSSAVARGKAALVTDDEEKVRALRAICQRWLPQHMDHFQQAIERSLAHTAVMRITLTEPPTGKRHE